jgi:hypothetical protein
MQRGILMALNLNRCEVLTLIEGVDAMRDTRLPPTAHAPHLLHTQVSAQALEDRHSYLRRVVLALNLNL